MKKICLFLCSCLVVLLSVIPVYSAEEPTFEIESVYGKQGDYISVNVFIRNNPGISAFQFEINYPDKNMELIEITDEKLFDENITNSPIENNPITISWYSKSVTNCKQNGAVVKLKFKILEEKSSELKLYYDPDNVFNSDFQNVSFNTINGEVMPEKSTGTNYQLGDVNQDGIISSSDVDLIQRSLVFLTDLSKEQIKLADVSKNGYLSVKDATLIQKYITNLIESLE